MNRLEKFLNRFEVNLRGFKFIMYPKFGDTRKILKAMGKMRDMETLDEGIEDFINFVAEAYARPEAGNESLTDEEKETLKTLLDTNFNDLLKQILIGYNIADEESFRKAREELKK